MSEDFVSQLSLEQTIEEVKDSAIQNAFFSSEEEAMKWLQK